MKKRSNSYLEKHLSSMEGSLATLKRYNREGKYYNNPYRPEYFESQIRITKMRLQIRSNK